MSSDKHRSLQRRLRLLVEAQRRPLLINWEDGIGSQNPDLRRLVAEGLIRLARYRHQEGDRVPAPKRFRNGPIETTGTAPRTRGVITPAGSAVLAAATLGSAGGGPPS